MSGIVGKKKTEDTLASFVKFFYCMIIKKGMGVLFSRNGHMA